MSDPFRTFERSVFGTASDTAPPGPPAPAARPSPFRQPMAWLKVALGMQGGNPPQALDTGQIRASIDAAASGWAFAVYEGLSLQVGATGGGIVALTPAFTDQQLVILDTDAAYVGAAPRGVQFGVGVSSLGVLTQTVNWAQPTRNPVQPNPPSPAIVVAAPLVPIIGEVTVPAGGVQSTRDIYGFTREPLRIPPGLVLYANILGAAIPAGEIITFNVTWARIPAGFRT